MAKALYEALQMDMPALAEMLRRKGRGRDTVLAHITPREAELLKKRGGSGTINPDTGLPQFEDSGYIPDITVPDYQAAGGGEFALPPTTTTGLPSDVSAVPVSDISAPTYYTGTSPTPQSTYVPSTNVDNSQFPFTPEQVQAGQSPTPAQLAQFQSQYPAATGQQQVDLLSSQPGVIGTEPTKPEKSTLDKLTEGLSNQDLIRLGLAGGFGALGLRSSGQAAGQIQQTTGQQQAIAQPYQTQGQQLISQAQQGQLNPASLQAYQAAQAQINQGIANRGGVGSQQAATQLANIYQQLLANQYNTGLQVSQIGDNIALGAIKTGMQLDQQLNTANQNFYTQLASIAAGLPVGSTRTTTPAS